MPTRANMAGVAMPSLKLVAAGAFAAGLLMGGGTAKVWYELFVVPDAIRATIEQQQNACLERVTAAADNARAREQLRQQLAGQSATSLFQKSLAEAAEAAAAIARQFEEENHALAQKLAEAGRSCPLDADTLRWLQRDGQSDR